MDTLVNVVALIIVVAFSIAVIASMLARNQANKQVVTQTTKQPIPHPDSQS